MSKESKKIGLQRMQELSEYVFDDRINLNQLDGGLTIKELSEAKKKTGLRNFLMSRVQTAQNRHNLTKKNIRRINKIPENIEKGDSPKLEIRNLKNEQQKMANFKIHISLEFPKIPTLDFFGLVNLIPSFFNFPNHLSQLIQFRISHS